MKTIEGGITAAKGFKASAVHAGIRKRKKDMALLFSEKDAVAAATFTTNVVKAAPVLWDIEVNKKGIARAVIINSGNANACTGSRGKKDTLSTALKTAKVLKTTKDKVFVASTGVIGVNLDMGKIEKGIDNLFPKLSKKGGSEASEAILTTDTYKKEIAVSLDIEGKTVTLGAMAKGSGMIHPDMATMLAFIATDAVIGKRTLQKLLGETVENTFNMISVDGDTSTNDSCIVLANGMAENDEIVEGGRGYEEFKEAFSYVLSFLAKQIVKDGEGAGKFIELEVSGAGSEEDAKKIARTVISSSLVKAAFFGSDANWGRVICAAGYSGASFDSDKVDIIYSSEKGEIEVLKKGKIVPFDEKMAKEILHESEIKVKVRLYEGSFSAVSWGCDLTYDYVRINSDYRS